MSAAPWLVRPLTAFFEAVGMLVGEEFPLEVVGGTPGQLPQSCPDNMLWVETRLAEGDDFSILLFGVDLVCYLGAQLLMLPEPPREITEEIRSAFDEIVNVAIGAWNREATDGLRWNNGVDARSIRPISVKAEHDRLTSGAFRSAGFTLAVGGKTHHLAVLGTGDWMPEEAVAAVVEGPAAPRTRAGAAVGAKPAAHGGGKGSPPPADDYIPALSGSVPPRPSPSGGRQAPPPFPGVPALQQAHADIALVDVSGVFLQWFYDQLKNPAFVFTTAPEDYLDSGQYRAVLLINPQALRDAGLSCDRQIIMRRS